MASAHVVPNAPAMRLEEGRIAFLIQRDGLAATVTWVRRTMHIYRRAVLDRKGFAGSDRFRRQFIVSYCDFKHWLAVTAVD
jgi:hypothetical protein